MKLLSFKNLRIFILLLVLAYVAIYTRSQELQSTSWIEPLQIMIIPINGDESALTAQYIKTLTAKSFQDIEGFFLNNIKKYGINYLEHPVFIELFAAINSLPPEPPSADDSIFSKMLWSLSLRNWASENTPDDESNINRVRIFVIYQQGDENRALSHSLGLQKGLIGVVHAYALEKQNSQNNVVIAHEIMHTVGANDKYQADGMPDYPDGYADPFQRPLHPQSKAEIMAGRIAVDVHESKMPESLSRVVVGGVTAREIGWMTSE